MRLPLSEEEQRILQEMEQKLREHDREFVDRVSHAPYRLQSARGAKWSAFGFMAGTALLLGTFRTSIALAVCGVLLMLVAALAFAQQISPNGGVSAEHGTADSRPAEQRTPVDPDDRLAEPSGERRSRPARAGIAEEWSEMRRRMRSRFGHRD